jgi:anti-sigma factor RsiW
MKEVNARNCGRENDLIAFLYGELNEVETGTFRRHVYDCASCNAEFEALRDVRESVVSWRNESLGLISEPPVARVEKQKPSALAALREFFNLAPLWMKGAVTFASILFCLFAGLAIARLRENPPVAIVTNQESLSAQEINARVEKRVQEELQRIKTLEEKTPVSNVVVRGTPERKPGARANRGNSVAFNGPSQKARRPLSKSEREQLAADLRLISGKNDSDLDLLDDRINE